MGYGKRADASPLFVSPPDRKHEDSMICPCGRETRSRPAGGSSRIYPASRLVGVEAQRVSTFELTGFIWKQGGKDMRSKELGESYLVNFEEMLTSLRADLSAPELPAFIATYVTPEQFETYDAPLKLTRPGMTAVLKAHLDAAETIPNVVTFSYGNLPSRIDGIHFNTEGQLKLGKMYAEAVERYYSANSADSSEGDVANNTGSIE